MIQFEPRSKHIPPRLYN